MGGSQGRAGLLGRLASLDRTTVFLATLALALVALFLPGAAGALLLYAVVAGLATLVSLTWTVTPAPMRAVRLLILAGLAVIATLRLL